MAIKIKVELDADAQRLTDTIQRAVAKGFQGGGTQGLATNPASVVRQIAGTQANGMRGYRDPMGGTSLPSSPSFLSNWDFFRSSRIPPTIASVQASNQQRSQAQQAQFLKNIGFAGIPLLSPGSVLGNLFASRQIFSGLSGPVGQGLLGKVGIGGTGATVAATGIVMAGLLSVGIALKGLQAAIRGTISAYDEARKLYAKSLTSGLGLQFTSNRQNLATVLGVSEKDVIKFGAAIAMIGPQLKFSTDILAKTAPNLASVSYELEILKLNMGALFATIANDFAPALRKLIDGISDGVKDIVGLYNILKQALSPTDIAILRGILAALTGGASEGRDIGPAPTPQGQMKQLPASALERMGLVVGGFGGGNDAGQRTAKATEQSAKLLGRLVQGMSAAGNVGGTFYDPMFSNP